MQRTISTNAGLAVAGLLGVYDLVAPALGGGAARPAPIALTGVVLGVVTLIGVAFAARGSRTGVIAVVISRVLSALTIVPAFFDGTVPSAVTVVLMLGLAVTAVVVALLGSALRAQPGDAAGTP